MGCGESEDSSVESRSKPVISVFSGDSGSTSQGGAVADPLDPPEITSADLTPISPRSGERLRVAPRVEGDWTSIRYEWQLNGTPFGANAAEVELPALSLGDVIEVGVTPIRGAIEGETFSVSQTVNDQPPVITGLDIRRVEAAEGDEVGRESWQAVVEVHDPTWETVVEYRWLVNGRPSDEGGDTIVLAGLKRDDTIEVEVRAFDGRLWSAKARSGKIQVGNAPPEIVSRPPRPGPEGSFRYVVRAEDPDRGDRLRFVLRKAPRGMRVSELEGVVSWSPDDDQAGKHEVEVVVDDGNGGEASQTFVLSLVESSSEAPPAAAK